MRIFQTSCILTVVFAICFSVTAPLFAASDLTDRHALELLDSGEENQTEHEENQEELSDDDFKNDVVFNRFFEDSKSKNLIEKNRQLAYHFCSDPTSPPPEFR